MDLFLDTCICTFMFNDTDKLTNKMKSYLYDDKNSLYCSEHSIFEWKVKLENRKTGSAFYNVHKVDDILDAVTKLGIEFLPVTMEVMNVFKNLIPNKDQSHKDPNDWLIIAHSIQLKMPIMSKDGKFDFYKDQGAIIIPNK